MQTPFYLLGRPKTHFYLIYESLLFYEVQILQDVLHVCMRESDVMSKFY